MPIKGSYKSGIPISLSKMFNLKTLDNENSTNSFSLNSTYGKGEVVINEFDKNYLTVEANLSVANKIKLDLDFVNSDVLLFLFVSRGSCALTFKDSKKKEKISSLCSISVFTESESINFLEINQGEIFEMNAICISKEKFLKVYDDFSELNICNKHLAKVLSDLSNNSYLTNYGFDIIEQLKKIKSLKSREDKMFLLKLKSRYQLILAFHLDGLYRGLFEDNFRTGLSSSELKIINQVADHISENPGQNHLQVKLCKQFFISQSKLQQGFKLVHKTTVSTFTKLVRLKKAEDLLKKGDLNVSEIVYTVGFTSRSYFSKIFKLQYGYSPTEYRNLELNKDIKTLN